MKRAQQDVNEFATVWAWLQGNKRIGAWLGFLMVGVSACLRGVVPQLLPITALIYLSALTSIVVDIHRRTGIERTIFPSHQEAAGVFFEEITGALHARGGCDLAWIGVTMQSAWLTLENALGRAIANGRVADLHLRLLQSDPQSLAKLLGSDDTQPQLAREQAEHMARFCERYEAELGSTGSSIELAQYDYMPNYHGLLINDEILYLATVRWTGPQMRDLSVPNEPFERFDRTTPRGRYMIELYKAWLDKGFAVASRYRRFPEAQSVEPDEGHQLAVSGESVRSSAVAAEVGVGSAADLATPLGAGVGQAGRGSSGLWRVRWSSGAIDRLSRLSSYIAARANSRDEAVANRAGAISR